MKYRPVILVRSLLFLNSLICAYCILRVVGFESVQINYAVSFWLFINLLIMIFGLGEWHGNNNSNGGETNGRK